MATKRTKREDEDPEEDDEPGPVRMKAAAGDHSGVLHVPHKGSIRQVRVSGGITEEIPVELEPALLALGYKRLGG